MCVYVCRSELNLGIQAAGFTVVKTCRPTEELKKYLTVNNTLNQLSEINCAEPNITVIMLVFVYL